jgi:hypothetical protein
MITLTGQYALFAFVAIETPKLAVSYRIPLEKVGGGGDPYVRPKGAGHVEPIRGPCNKK